MARLRCAGSVFSSASLTCPVASIVPTERRSFLQATQFISHPRSVSAKWDGDIARAILRHKCMRRAVLEVACDLKLGNVDSQSCAETSGPVGKYARQTSKLPESPCNCSFAARPFHMCCSCGLSLNCFEKESRMSIPIPVAPRSGPNDQKQEKPRGACHALASPKFPCTSCGNMVSY